MENKQTAVEWLFLMLNNPNSNQDFANKLLEQAKQMERKQIEEAAVSCWVAFDWMKIETRPTEYGKYLICRKDGKIHWETWNGSGWAYNHNEIRFWAVIVPPCS